uniref:Transposase n=1 Tax=Mesocestoides corti TaxID=53468 RepID=A0A5K3FJM1_MESCO
MHFLNRGLGLKALLWKNSAQFLENKPETHLARLIVLATEQRIGSVLADFSRLNRVIYLLNIIRKY